MKFGRTLRNAVISKWESQYVDYTTLKNLLKEDFDKHTQWTENDENKFCDAIFNVELNKVADFHEETFKKLESRTRNAASELQKLASESEITNDSKATARFKEIEATLDDIITETKDLKKYSEINYTAFLKIVKKHDRKRGNNYKIRPLLLMSLNKRPFNSVQRYTPLLTKLSVLFYVVRQHLDEESDVFDVTTSEHSRLQNGERYTAYKFWIHPENLLEVKTYILRRLPVLIYSQVSSKNPEVAQIDPAINSLYFDSPDFILYNGKVNSQVTSSSLRLRWYGQLNARPEVFIEQKTVYENGTSEERRFPIKEKYIQSFIKGEYSMEKSVAKMERQEQPEAKIQEFKKTVSDIQNLILDNKLQPVLRANYSRTAFQKPLDDKVRISIDTNLVFIREDSLDSERPFRDSENWHRLDVDNMHTNYPFENLNKGDIDIFPYALLEIKVKDEDGKENPKWIEDLMTSHLVHEIPRFSKFVHGVVVLFEDYVNYLPYWLSDLEVEIRKDPQAAFEEEKQQKAKRDENDQLVGSLLGTSKMTASSHKTNISPSLGKSYLQERFSAEEQLSHQSDLSNKKIPKGPSDETSNLANKTGGYGTMASIFPSFSSSRYARFRHRSVALPPGVTKPELLIKDSGPIQVEPKVWLANERTFVKWMQIAIQLAILGVGLNSAGSATKTEDKKITTWFGAVFVIIAAFTGCWGLYMQRVRRRLIFERSGKDFDNWIGPLIVGCSFLLALFLNFFLKFRAVKARNSVLDIAESTYDQTRFTEL
ncbi:Vacuolar transporter chaperone 2 [Golovinomyces cichoracearum]|uniref:Vacuolar transporter chaperone 2 n=1 Tax=Golovinomyces cichoracearum TaxID=62708 RepID=A0A420IWZ2_9PEZI|nr:Vacuolar transporter chaperone 2 [Golovinomyces cichoracearum]